MTDPIATADLCDAHPDLVQIPELAWLHVGRRSSFCGPALTLALFEDNSLVRRSLEQPGRGRVLVVDGGGSMRRALVGDRLAQLAMEHQWAGVVVYGCIRDRAVIDTLEIGIKCLGTTPKKTEKRGEGRSGVPVTFGGARFETGHWVYADADGVLVAPHALH